MFQIDLKTHKAIYEQIIDNFKRLITRGVLREDERIPSVRDLSKELMVNPNTIQKAYRELERQGYFYTVLGQGNFVNPRPKNVERQKVAGIYERLKEPVRDLLFYGEKEEDIIGAIREEILKGGRNDSN